MHGTAGLRRSGKSCRLRWVNYLRPDLKRGKITPDEETVILHLHAMLGNRYVPVPVVPYTYAYDMIRRRTCTMMIDE